MRPITSALMPGSPAIFRLSIAVVGASPMTSTRSVEAVRTARKRASQRATISATVSMPHIRNGCERPVNSSARTPSTKRTKIAVMATSVGASSSVVLLRTNWSRS